MLERKGFFMPIGTILREDDFVVGQMVTVYENKIDDHKNSRIIGGNSISPEFIMGIVPQNNKEDYSILKGRVMCIKAINLPYIVLTAFDFNTLEKDQTFPVDVRQCLFMLVSEEYCQAIFNPCRFKEIEDEVYHVKSQAGMI